MTRLAIVGSRGTTGALVAAEATARGLDHADLVRADFADLPRACAGADVIVNCAGPFSQTRGAVERAAMLVGLPVVHLCGEPSELADLFESSGALTVPVVGGAGFSPAVAELACWLAMKSIRAEELEIAHGATASVPSLGSLRSYLRDVDRASDHDEAKVVDFPAPLGPRAVRSAFVAEDVAVPRSTGVDRVRTFFAIGPPRLAAARTAVYLRDRNTLHEMIAVRESGARGPDAEERARSHFALVVTARGAQGTRRVEMTGSDPYGVTAVIAVQCALDVARSPHGAHTALQVLDPQVALAALARVGVRFKTHTAS